MMVSQIGEQVNQYRLTKDRRAGSRSLFYNLGIKAKYGIGVSKFEELMSQYGYSLLPLRVKVVTTQSSCQSWNYKNLCNGLVINGINQLVVGDLTYITLGKHRYYLFCLTDYYSLRIVGYCISDIMRKQEALETLKKFIKLRGYINLENCIHHTDGGSQYFSSDYLNKLGKNIRISVATNCLENGLAEQKNGFIKHHLIPTVQIDKLHVLGKEIDRIIDFYNCERKQEKLGWKTPEAFENQKISKNKIPVLRLHDHEKNIPSLRFGF
jgi:transposase InsO family protein